MTADSNMKPFSINFCIASFFTWCTFVDENAFFALPWLISQG